MKADDDLTNTRLSQIQLSVEACHSPPPPLSLLFLLLAPKVSGFTRNSLAKLCRLFWAREEETCRPLRNSLKERKWRWILCHSFDKHHSLNFRWVTSSYREHLSFFLSRRCVLLLTVEYCLKWKKERINTTTATWEVYLSVLVYRRSFLSIIRHPSAREEEVSSHQSKQQLFLHFTRSLHRAETAEEWALERLKVMAAWAVRKQYHIG